MKSPLKNTEPVDFEEGKFYKVGKNKKMMEFTMSETLARRLAVMKGKRRIKRVELKNGMMGYLV